MIQRSCWTDRVSWKKLLAPVLQPCLTCLVIPLGSVTLRVKLSVTAPKARPTLMRVCMAIDRESSRLHLLLQYPHAFELYGFGRCSKIRNTHVSAWRWAFICRLDGILRCPQDEDTYRTSQIEWSACLIQGLSEVRARVEFTEYAEYRPSCEICKGCHKPVLGQNQVPGQ